MEKEFDAMIVAGIVLQTTLSNIPRIEKYLNIATNMVQDHNLEPYYKQRLMLIRNEINQLFKIEDTGIKQIKLAEFV